MSPRHRYRLAILNPSSVLVQFPSGMGNTVLALPAFNALRRALPEADFHAVYRLRPSDELLELEDTFSSITFLPVANPWRQSLHLYHLVRRQQIDAAISFFGNYDYRYNIVLRLAGVKWSAGFDHPRAWLFSPFLTHVQPYAANRHESENNIRLATLLGAQTKFANYPKTYSKQYSKKVSEKTAGKAAGTHQQVAIHVGRLNEEKPGWPVQRFLELIDALRSKWQVSITVLGGKEELMFRSDFDDVLLGHDFNCIGRLTVQETLHKLAGQDLVVCNDTGPMHLAAMCDIPVVALFGPTDSVKSAPVPNTRSHRIIVSSGLVCQPCYPHKVKQYCQGRVDCLTSISVEQVLKACQQYLQ